VDYTCSNGHEISTFDNDKKLTKCLGMVDGAPCTGTLTRVGEGVRQDNRCEGAGHHAEPLKRSPKKGRCPECGKAIVLTKEGKLRFHERKTVSA
jgi:hypothetical protein